MTQNEDILRVLRHDLHKIRIARALRHRDALDTAISKQADGIAAYISRNFLHERFEEPLYRKSLLLQTQNLQNPRTLVNQHRLEAAELFSEDDAYRLHSTILSSKLLNLYAEARSYPYTSLKYHILLTCALFCNFKRGYKWHELYLGENCALDSPFQIIYQDNARTWALLPKIGMAKLHPRFYTTWERRTQLSLGGEHQILDELLTTIGSWSVALATLDDFFALLR